MERVACVDIAALPLQILLKQHPDWREDPVVVVDRDAAQGAVCWMNQRARAAGIRTGMRYAAALSITHTLRGAHVPDADIRKSLDRHFTVLIDSDASEDARADSRDALLTALGGGYEAKVRLRIIRGLVGNVDDVQDLDGAAAAPDGRVAADPGSADRATTALGDQIPVDALGPDRAAGSV